MRVLAILLILSSCRTTQPKEFIAERCQIVLHLESAPFCRCVDYKISKDYIGPISKSRRYSADHCDQIIGYSVKDNETLVNFMQWVRLQILNGKEHETITDFDSSASDLP
jgi:hypothetical protein